ncbi:glycosyltransferase [Croceicoccus hydrothermalis]|uniref:glycosyltransferase n=1 Tax=Croceicoccus hydrothermalis TaxID=2867964 RepID=UPI001EFB2499|nr:glycosyltransferase [Croceicoccus hydrothermalis]
MRCLIDEVLQAEPFSGRARLCAMADTITGFEHAFVVTVPARNEADYGPRCMKSVAEAIRQADRRGAVVVVVHDSADRSFDLIAAALAVERIEALIVEVSFDADIRNAPHARRLALDLAARICPVGALLTTDADTTVSPQWCRRMLAPISTGYDLVCEDMHLDDSELAQLPVMVRQVGEAERALFDASNALWLRWTGGAHGVFAHRPSGASMAIRSAIYARLGGLPLPTVGEDMALCEAALGAQCAVLTLSDCGTRTSARIAGRADGGCGAALKDRAGHDDPSCDGRLLKIEALRSLADNAIHSRGMPFGEAAQNRPQPLRYSEVLIELEKALRLLA